MKTNQHITGGWDNAQKPQNNLKPQPRPSEKPSGGNPSQSGGKPKG